MEIATPKLLQSRQLDHAFAQFELAGQLAAWLLGQPTQKPGQILWQQVCVLCTAVSVQLRRARTVAVDELRGRHITDVDGGLVAPRLPVPSKPTDADDIGHVLDGRLSLALSLLEQALAAPSMPCEASDSDTEDDHDPWPPSAEDLRASEFLHVLQYCRADDFEALLRRAS